MNKKIGHDRYKLKTGKYHKLRKCRLESNVLSHPHYISAPTRVYSNWHPMVRGEVIPILIKDRLLLALTCVIRPPRIVDTYAGPTMGCIKTHGGGPDTKLEDIGYTTGVPSTLVVCSRVCARPHPVRPALCT